MTKPPIQLVTSGERRPLTMGEKVLGLPGALVFIIALTGGVAIMLAIPVLILMAVLG